MTIDLHIPRQHSSLLSTVPSASASADVAIGHVQLRDLIVCPRDRGVVWYVGHKTILEHDISKPNSTPYELARLTFTAVTLSALDVSTSSEDNRILLAAGGQESDLYLALFSYLTKPKSSPHSSSQSRSSSSPSKHSELIWEYNSALPGSINNSVLLYHPPPFVSSQKSPFDPFSKSHLGSSGSRTDSDSKAVPRLVVSNNDCTVKFFDISLECDNYSPEELLWRRVHRRRAFPHGKIQRLENVGVLKLNVPVNHTSISPDGSTILSCGDSPQIYLHRLLPSHPRTPLTFIHLATYTLPTSPLYPSPFSSTTSSPPTPNPYAAYPSSPYAPSLYSPSPSWSSWSPWSWPNPSGPPSSCFSTTWSSDGSKFAVASQEGMVCVWDVRSQEVLEGARWETQRERERSGWGIGYGRVGGIATMDGRARTTRAGVGEGGGGVEGEEPAREGGTEEGSTNQRPSHRRTDSGADRIQVAQNDFFTFMERFYGTTADDLHDGLPDDIPDLASIGPTSPVFPNRLDRERVARGVEDGESSPPLPLPLPSPGPAEEYSSVPRRGDGSGDWGAPVPGFGESLWRGMGLGRVMPDHGGPAPGWGVRCVKFVKMESGRELLVFTEHTSLVHIIDAETFTQHDVIRIPQMRRRLGRPQPIRRRARAFTSPGVINTETNANHEAFAINRDGLNVWDSAPRNDREAIVSSQGPTAGPEHRGPLLSPSRFVHSPEPISRNGSPLLRLPTPPPPLPLPSRPWVDTTERSGYESFFGVPPPSARRLQLASRSARRGRDWVGGGGSSGRGSTGGGGRDGATDGNGGGVTIRSGDTIGRFGARRVERDLGAEGSRFAAEMDREDSGSDSGSLDADGDRHGDENARERDGEVPVVVIPPMPSPESQEVGRVLAGHGLASVPSPLNLQDMGWRMDMDRDGDRVGDERRGRSMSPPTDVFRWAPAPSRSRSRGHIMVDGRSPSRSPAVVIRGLGSRSPSPSGWMSRSRSPSRMVIVGDRSPRSRSRSPILVEAAAEADDSGAMDVDYDGFSSERECTPSRATSPAPPSGAAASGSASGSNAATSPTNPQSQSQSQTQTSPSSGPGPSSSTAMASDDSPRRRFLDDRDLWSKDVEVDLAGLTFDRTGSYVYVASLHGVTEWEIKNTDTRWWCQGSWA
ncbi:hypothetical protein BD410DRAFT_902795 [Rickenella mellea]|uniref:DUF2415 domain-containing protein n=1 Tax=Rickenella mellea TaxID=50990 RepID=A0A4Y7PHT3_9AGAM|nr:hypothetical protein BD410DRAFT_902795 [Rickenella mellea]